MKPRAVFWSVAAICAISRPLAMARSPWGWDEVLFTQALRAYDVTQHHPHPPGYPLFIALGKALGKIAGLQTVNLIAGALLFPIVFFLARELRMRFETAVIAGALFAFVPTVWFYGGTAFSDVTSIAIAMASAALLLRGRRVSGFSGAPAPPPARAPAPHRDLTAMAFFAGAFLLGCAIAVRPQNLLIGLVPLWGAGVPAGEDAGAPQSRSFRRIAAALPLIAAPVIACYGAAAAASGGWTRFVAACRWQSAYVRRVDSFLNPHRASLESLFERFFVMPYGWNPLSIVLSLLAIASMVMALRRRDRNLLLLALIFAPFAIAAWLMLDPFSVRRYAIGYLPMFILFAADAIERVGQTFLSGRRNGQTRMSAPHIIAAILILSSMAWTAPALVRVMRTDSPPVAAVEALRGSKDEIFVAYAMVPYVAAFAPDLQYVVVEDEYALPLSAATPHPLLLAEIDRTTPSGRVFSRPHDQLWQIALHRYFTVAIEPVTRSATFGEGWLPPERSGHDEWRWMESRSVMHLPPLRQRAYLRLAVDAHDAVPVEIRINGVVRDKFTADSQLAEHSYDVPDADRDNVVEIVAGGRLRLRWLGWGERNR